MARAFLSVTALVFGVFGLWGLVAPQAMVNNFGITLDNPSAVTMIRASYGGFLIGEASVIGYCALAETRARFGLIAVLLLTSPIFATRLLGLALDGEPSMLHLTYLSIELVGICGASALLRIAR